MSSPPLIVGTAGHIDHGKTALVQALTGTDTDRLPQEKQRGMTIDIGFAELNLGDRQLGMIDVPGHERFIKNMLAGAATIDLALLVVAADDSVMPQTREHLAILDLLGVQQGVIALTKCDLREEAWLELVVEEIRELLADTRLADVQIVRTAVPAGGPAQGIDDLKTALAQVADQVVDRPVGELFRLCVDRSFSVAGRGTVVTGTVCSGSAKLGENLDWWPAGSQLQVRGLQNHGRDVEEVSRGQRAAINLASVAHHDIGRGDVLATCNSLRPTSRLTVELAIMPGSPWPVKHRGRYSLHIGTQAVGVEVYLFESGALAAGERGLAQLHCSEPIVAVWGQPLVLRMESPLATLGGGHVWQPAPPVIRRRQGEKIKRLKSLGSASPDQRVATAIYFLGHQPWHPEELRRETGLEAPQIETILAELVATGRCLPLTLPTGRVVHLHADRLAEVKQIVLETVDRHHTRQPLKLTVPKGHVLESLKEWLGRELTDAVIATLVDAGELTANKQQVARVGFSPQLDDQQQQCLDQIEAAYLAAQCSPPTLAELSSQLAVGSRDIRPLVQLCADRGQLVHIHGETFLARQTEQQLRHRLRDRLTSTGGMTVSQIRDILETNRKFAVPLCEYLDRVGFTRRDGDLRTLAETQDGQSDP